MEIIIVRRVTRPPLRAVFELLGVGLDGLKAELRWLIDRRI
jgi:hypothetical protein